MNVPPPQPATQRIAVIDDSLRAFLFAWFGLVPLAGLPFALIALSLGFRAWRRETDVWNPAAGYRSAALWLGALGTGVGFLALVLIVGAMIFG